MFWQKSTERIKPYHHMLITTLVNKIKRMVVSLKVWIQAPRLSTNCLCGGRFWRVFLGAKVGTVMQAHRDGMRAAGNVAGPRSRTGKPQRRLLVQATRSSAYLCAHDENELRGFEERSGTGRPYRPSAPLGRPQDPRPGR